MEPPRSHKPWCDDKTVWSHLKDTDLTISSMMMKFTIFWNEPSLNSHVTQYGGKSYFKRHRLYFLMLLTHTVNQIILRQETIKNANFEKMQIEERGK